MILQSKFNLIKQDPEFIFLFIIAAVLFNTVVEQIKIIRDKNKVINQINTNKSK